MPLTTSLIVAGSIAAAKTGFGLAQHASAANDLAKLQRPSYTIPQEWYNNENIAGSEAEHGLTEPAMNYFNKQSQSGLSSGIGTVLQAGGNLNSINNLYDSYNNGQAKIAAEDAQTKNDNIAKYIDANSQLANEKEKQWTLNEYEPYKDRVKSDYQKEGAGDQNTFSGLNDLSNAVTSYGIGSNYGETIPKPASLQAQQDAMPELSTASAGVTMPGLNNNIAFSTPGGSDTLRSMATANPNSSYIQDLLKTMRQAQTN